MQQAMPKPMPQQAQASIQAQPKPFLAPAPVSQATPASSAVPGQPGNLAQMIQALQARKFGGQGGGLGLLNAPGQVMKAEQEQGPGGIQGMIEMLRRKQNPVAAPSPASTSQPIPQQAPAGMPGPAPSPQDSMMYAGGTPGFYQQPQGGGMAQMLQQLRQKPNLFGNMGMGQSMKQNAAPWQGGFKRFGFFGRNNAAS